VGEAVDRALDPLHHGDDLAARGQQVELGLEAVEVAGVVVAEHEDPLELGRGGGITLAVTLHDLPRGRAVAVRRVHVLLVPVPRHIRVRAAG
jgi:hypothetical protein